MAYYHVEIGYQTKRGGVALGMTVKAFDPDEAEGIARDHTLKGYPARKWRFSNVREADAADIRIGVVNEPKAPQP